MSIHRWWAAFLHLAIRGSRLLPITQSITPRSYALLCFQTVLGKLKKPHLLFKIPWLRGGTHLSHSYSTCGLYLGAIGYTLPLPLGQGTLLSFPSGHACHEKGGRHSGRCLAVSVIVDCCLLYLPRHGSICYPLTWWCAAGHVQL